MDTAVLRCKYCLGEEDEEDVEFVWPCECRDPVCQTCITAWYHQRQHNPLVPVPVACEICKHEYAGFTASLVRLYVFIELLVVILMMPILLICAGVWGITILLSIAVCTALDGSECQFTFPMASAWDVSLSACFVLLVSVGMLIGGYYAFIHVMRDIAELDGSRIIKTLRWLVGLAPPVVFRDSPTNLYIQRRNPTTTLSSAGVRQHAA